jgi:23S rRNA (adenine2503-C2)-methyltransferase
MPARFLEKVAAELACDLPSVALETRSSDGFTRKYLLALHDGHRIETVLMRYQGRTSACVSSQVGCAMGCVFCATGQMGYTRHLTAAEIVAQALHVDAVLRATAAPAGENPDAPEIVLEAGRSSAHYWKDLWRYRELAGFLAWRDIKVRYKQAVLGVAWAIIQPAWSKCPAVC